MKDEGRGLDKRACLFEERWHCISIHFFLSHHHHRRCVGFPVLHANAGWAIYCHLHDEPEHFKVILFLPVVSFW